MKRARVITGGAIHESNTFSSSRTDLERFREGKLFDGAAVFDALRGTESEVGGFMAAAEEEAFDLIPTVYVPVFEHLAAYLKHLETHPRRFVE